MYDAHMRRVHILVTPEIHAAVAALAQARGQTVSEWIRNAIADKLSEDNK